jgi:hypothetical protein
MGLDPGGSALDAGSGVSAAKAVALLNSKAAKNKF